MDRGAWWAAVHGVAKSQTRLSDFTFTFPFHALAFLKNTHILHLLYQIEFLIIKLLKIFVLHYFVWFILSKVIVQLILHKSIASVYIISN